MCATITFLLPMETAFGQPDQKTKGNTYSLSYSPVYQFDTDLDNGGSFSVQRHYLHFSGTRELSRKLKAGVSLNYEFEKWEFSDLSTVAGATPWEAIHRPGISLPFNYTFSGYWTLGITPTIQFSGESGAKIDESLIYGGALSLTRPFSRNFYIGVGLGVFDRLEQVGAFPFIILHWQINSHFRIANPFRVGPAGPAGLEVVYSPMDKWEFGVGGAYRSYRFRLNDTSAVPDGVGNNSFFVAFARIQRKLGKAMSLDLVSGGLFNGEVSIEDDTGDELASDTYAASPFMALTVSGKF
jgi:hypothetical protein